MSFSVIVLYLLAAALTLLYCTCFIYCHLNFDSTLFEFHRICTQLFVPLVRGVHRAPSRARAFVRARAKNWLGSA